MIGLFTDDESAVNSPHGFSQHDGDGAESREVDEKHQYRIDVGHYQRVVPDILRTLVLARPCGDDLFAAGTVSPSRDMSRYRRVDHSLEVT